MEVIVSMSYEGKKVQDIDASVALGRVWALLG